MTIQNLTVDLNDLFSYIVVKDIDGDYIDHMLNLKPISERYLQTFQDVSESKAKNILMTIADVQLKGLSAVLSSENDIDMYQLEEYTVSEFRYEFSELFE